MRLDIALTSGTDITFTVSGTVGAGTITGYKLTASVDQIPVVAVTTFTGDSTVGPFSLDPGVWLIFASDGTLSRATHLHVPSPNPSTLRQATNLVRDTIVSANYPGLSNNVYDESVPRDDVEGYPCVWVYTEDARTRDTGEGTDQRTQRVYSVTVLIGQRGEIVDSNIQDAISAAYEFFVRAFDWMTPANALFDWTRAVEGPVNTVVRSAVFGGGEKMFAGSRFTVDCYLKQTRGFP